MKIIDAIRAADQLSPNHFTFDEKLSWCDELNLTIRSEIKREYKRIETTVTPSGDIDLPNDIAFEDVEVVSLDGKVLDKLDLRSFRILKQSIKAELASGTRPLKLKIIYLDKPEQLKDIRIKGSFEIDGDKIYVANPPFSKGDIIQYVFLSDLTDIPDWDGAAENCIGDVYEEYMELVDPLILPGDQSADGSSGSQNSDSEADTKIIAIKRELNDETLLEAPYDRAYIEHLLSKMALYQHDYESYDAHVVQFNNIIDEYRRHYKLASPKNRLSVFKNYW